MARQEFAGAAARTTLASGINNTDLTFTVASGTGHPTGTNPFVMVIDRGLSTEEKILCTSRSGTTFTVHASGRGYDGTTAQAHSAGAYVEHVVSAAKLDELDAYVNSAATGDVTTASGAKVTTIANNAVTTAKIIDGAVTLPKLADIATASFLGRTTSGTGDVEVLTVAQALALLALDSTDLTDFTEAVQDVLGAQVGLGGAGLTFAYDDAGNATSIVVNVDGSTLEISADALRVKALGVDTAHLAANAVTAAKITDGVITAAKISNEAWTSYVPAVKNTGQAAVTATVDYAKYHRVGRTIYCNVQLSITSNSAGAGVILVDLPVAVAAHGLMIGTFSFIDDSDTDKHYGAWAYTNTGTTPDTVYGITTPVAPADGMAIQLATGDVVRCAITYEAAS